MGDIIILILMIILAVSKTIEAVLTFNEVCEDRSNNHCNNLNDSSDDFPERRFLIPRLLIAGICIGTTVEYGIIVVKEIFL